VTEPAIYVDVYELARAVLVATRRFPKDQRFTLARRMNEAALDLAEAVALAVYADAAQTTGHLVVADAALVRLRLATRLARDLDILGEGPAVALGTRTAAIGRQIGGWQKASGPL
jgi:hypothetical protein